MKVSIAIVTTNDDGNVSVDAKPFKKFDDAAKHLHNEYLSEKAALSANELYIGNDEVTNITEESTKSFYIEDVDGKYWVNGVIYTLDLVE